MKFRDFLQRFEKPKPTGKGFVVKCPAHEDKSPSLSLTEGNDGRILVNCHAGCKPEDVVRAMGLALQDLFPEDPVERSTFDYRASEPKVASNTHPKAENAPKAEIERIYSYRDVTGAERYQAIRLKPKSFRQRHKVNGQWIWNMDGVERVLYNLPEMLAAKQVWIVEGEKDADNLMKLGLTATCNVGGAGKWLDGYTESLLGKDVVICGDNDKPGREHVQKVFESLAGHAKSVRLVTIPLPHKDVSDLIATQNNAETSRAYLDQQAATAVPFVDGVKMPLYSMLDIEPMYLRQAQKTTRVHLRLEAFLPTIGAATRPLIPGDMMLVIGDTGAGKTALLVNLWKFNRHLRTIFFQQELPLEAMFERFISTTHNMTGREVETSYRAGQTVGESAILELFGKLIICPECGLTLERLEQMVCKSELTFGERPQLVLIDYAQLSKCSGKSRYEMMSNFAEGLKVLAKRTATIVVVSSQVSRPKDGDGEIGLHSAKDSGSLENSCGIALGAWRDENDTRLLTVKVLKATKGGAGAIEECDFDGAKMLIKSRRLESASKVSDEDVPRE